jgi:hypothetical protein
MRNALEFQYTNIDVFTNYQIVVFLTKYFFGVVFEATSN